MLQAISRYTQNIAMIIIFVSVINLIMPNGSFEKYIKMVLGLIVIITILAPINTFVFKNKPDYTDILKRYEIDIENTSMKVQSGQYLESQKDIILENYKEQLIPQMVGIVEKNGDLTVLEVDMGFNEDVDSAEFGKITDIDMLVEKSGAEPSTKVIKVPKIKVGTKKIQSYSKDQIDGQIEEKIKTSIIDFYNLPNANINIIVQKNS